MRWLLEVAFIGIASSWRWLLGSVAVVGALVGILFGVGVLGGGGDGDSSSPPIAVSPTPTPAAAGTLVPTPTPIARSHAPEATAVPAPMVISVPILATRANNVGSLEFVLVYDPAKLELARVERGVLAGDALIDSSSPGLGRLWAAIIDVHGITGSGSVAVVKFNVRSNVGGTMPLTLENISAFDVDTLVDIMTETTPGRFNGPDLAPLSPIVTFQ